MSIKRLKDKIKKLRDEIKDIPDYEEQAVVEDKPKDLLIALNATSYTTITTSGSDTLTLGNLQKAVKTLAPFFETEPRRRKHAFDINED